MSTPTRLLQKKIRSKEDALRAREVETLAREAELEDLKESLQKLESARSSIRGAIEDALSDDPTTTIAPTDLIEMAVEGGGRGSSNNNKTANAFPDENMTAEEAVNLALISMKQDLGSGQFVKYILSTAAEVSGLDGEAVIKAALDTTRSSNLRTSDVVSAALRAARDSPLVFAPHIIGPAVEIAMRRGIEPPVIVKEAFVNATRGDPSLMRSSILSLLGCSVGMGMEYRDIKGLVKAFSEEIEHGQMGQDGASDSTKKVRFDIPPQAQSPGPASAQDPQQPQPSENTGGAGHHDADPSLVKAFVKAALDSINSGGQGMPAIGDPMTMRASWPHEYSAACKAVEDILAERSSVAGESSKRSAGDKDEDEDEEQGRPSKLIKLNYSREDGQERGQ